MKLAVLFTRFGPYHLARLRAVRKPAQVVGIELSGRQMDYAWDTNRDDLPFDSVTVFPDRVHTSVSIPELQHKISNTLTRIAPDVVAIPGWHDPGALAALRYCVDSDTPSVIMSESTEHDAPRMWWRETVKRRLLQTCQAALVGGTPHAAYLRRLGVPDGQIFLGYDVVDNTHFWIEAERARAQESEVRDRLDLPDRYFLASCRFIPKKNLKRLLRAYKSYTRTTSHPWSLVLLGDGPLRSDLERQRAELGLHDLISMPGFKQYEELPAYYGLAQAFVHISTTEQWGLVVNEAMAAGLPVIVSHRCGCAPDLVDPQHNGFVIDPYDVDDITRRLIDISSADCNRDAMARASRDVVTQWGPDRFGTSMVRAARVARNAPMSNKWIDSALLRGLCYV